LSLQLFPKISNRVVLIHQRHRRTDDMQSQYRALHYSGEPDFLYHRLFVPSSDFSYRCENSTETNENGVKNNIRKPKRRQIETATML